MSAATNISFEEFRKLQDAAEETVRYELDEGKLFLTPSLLARDSFVRYRLRCALTDFVSTHHLGLIVDGIDFRLSPNTVRKADVAYIPAKKLTNPDLDRSPIDGAPSLAVEIISPTNLAQDTLKKVCQYLAAGSQAVWLVYPALRVVEFHAAAGVRDIAEPQFIQEERLFSGLTFSLSLTALFARELRQ